MENIGVRQLSESAFDFVRRADAGEEFVVIVAGRPAARLIGAAPGRWCTWQQVEGVFESPAAESWWDDDAAGLLLDDSVRDPWAAR